MSQPLHNALHRRAHLTHRWQLAISWSFARALYVYVKIWENDPLSWRLSAPTFVGQLVSLTFFLVKCERKSEILLVESLMCKQCDCLYIIWLYICVGWVCVQPQSVAVTAQFISHQAKWPHILSWKKLVGAHMKKSLILTPFFWCVFFYVFNRTHFNVFSEWSISNLLFSSRLYLCSRRMAESCVSLLLTAL